LLLFLALALFLGGGAGGDIADLADVHLVPFLLHEDVAHFAAALGVEHFSGVIGWMGVFVECAFCKFIYLFIGWLID